MRETLARRIPALPRPDPAAAGLVAGAQVDVQNRFDGSWAGGFEIADVLGPPSHRTYRIRRLSDGEILPRVFDGGVVVETRTPSTGRRPARPTPSSPYERPALGLLVS